MNFRLFLNYALLIAVALVVVGCAEEDEVEEKSEPVEITVGVAIAEPAAPTSNAIEPAIVYDGARIHMVYCQNDGVGQHNVVYTQRLGGSPFTTPAPVFGASAGDSRNPHVFLDSAGTLHMVWEEGTTPNRDIYYATRDSGGTLSTPSNLSNSPEDDAAPRVEVDSSGTIHVVWTGSTPPPNPTTSVFYRRKPSSLFLAATTLPKVPGQDFPAEMPDITSDPGGRVYVVWSESNGSTRNIRMVRSDDGGANYGSVANYAVSGSVDMTSPRVAAGLDGEIFLAFTGQGTSGERGLYVTFTRTGGTFAGPDLLLTSDTGGIHDAEITSFRRPDDDFTVVVVCNDGTNGPTGGGSVIGFASHDNGVNYPGDPVNFSQGNTQPATNKVPVVALDNNEVIVAWQGQPQGAGVVRTWTSSNDYNLP